MAHGRADSLSLSLKMQRYMENLIVGIDFSKKTLNYCVLSGSVDNIAAEGVLGNNRKGWSSLLRLARKRLRACDACALLFCGEDTGLCSWPAAEWLTSHGCRVWLGDAFRMSRSMGYAPEKTDASDARRIADYAFRYSDKAVDYVPMTEADKRLRLLEKQHRTLTDVKVKLKNTVGALSALLEGQTRELEDTLAYVSERLKAVDRKIERLLKTDPELAPNAALAVSVPGVSYTTAAAVMVDTRNFTRFTDGRKYAAHVGCVPYRCESGTSLKRRPHVSKHSNRRLNSLLTQGAVSIMTRNRQMMEYARRKRAEGKNTGFIINNIRCKTIKRLFAVIRDRTPFREDYRNCMECRKTVGLNDKCNMCSHYLT